MSEMFPETKQPKLYRNGKTYLENVRNGLFQNRNALKFQTEMRSKMDKIEDKLSKIVEKLSD